MGLLSSQAVVIVICAKKNSKRELDMNLLPLVIGTMNYGKNSLSFARILWRIFCLVHRKPCERLTLKA